MTRNLEAASGAISVRSPSPQDADAIAELRRAVNVAEIGNPYTDAADVLTRLTDPGIDLDRDWLLVTTQDGELVGSGTVWVEPPPRMLRICSGLAAIGGSVLPRPSDRDAGASGGPHLAGRHPGPIDGPRSGRAAGVPSERRGDGEHWGHATRDLEAWHHELTGFEGFDPGLVLLATDGGDVVGSAVFIAGTPEFPESGWMAELSVLPAWRRRGIATAIVLHGLGALYARGFRHANTGVDSENPTRAGDLYSRLGFRPTTGHSVFEREIGRGGGAAS